jgi:hypothetical protein
MRLRRSVKKVNQELVEAICDLWLAFELHLAHCGELTAERERGEDLDRVRSGARTCAANLSLYARYVFDSLTLLEGPWPSERLLPRGVLPAVSRLIYGLIALAELDPEPEALLSADEISGLVEQYGLQDWMDRWRVARESVREAQS